MKIKFLADKDLSLHIVDGVRRANANVDFLARAVPDGLPDPEVLRLAAEWGRVLVSHDVSTMPGHFERFLERHESPGVILVPQRLVTRDAIARLVATWEEFDAVDLANQLWFA